MIDTTIVNSVISCRRTSMYCTTGKEREREKRKKDKMTTNKYHSIHTIISPFLPVENENLSIVTLKRGNERERENKHRRFRRGEVACAVSRSIIGRQ
mmetsp:Transcript_50418/g.51309  ORF Transcript_50418/g.51309 Transcript_50418/m.51309 type:complete len:97 (+) Transcript_50418:152-442(+)